ncbi:MAG: dephospho-CoA kinase [Gemmatimonas sp.]|nr:dephospho-CoA kinase [Gemmatimonas sp.]
MPSSVMRKVEGDERTSPQDDRRNGRCLAKARERSENGAVKMLKVALTGNVASGKSSVVRCWRELGAVVVESDDLARRAVAPGSTTLETIVERWGPGILLESGELDRAAMRDVVFLNAEERRALEAIIHPEVERLRTAAFDDAARSGAELVVADIPLLFEVGLEGEFDLVVLVDAPEDVRRERLVRDRGLPVGTAQRMVDSQWPTERKRQGVDILIENTGSLAELEGRAKEVWSELRLRAKASSGRHS